MEQKRKEVQRESHGCQVLLTMAVVMFEVIALGFQGIVVLVLDVPAGSSGLHDGLHSSTIQVVLRRKRMAIQSVTFVFIRECVYQGRLPEVTRQARKTIGVSQSMMRCDLVRGRFMNRDEFARPI